jgi:hypothetical protein
VFFDSFVVLVGIAALVNEMKIRAFAASCEWNHVIYGTIVNSGERFRA